jgi:uroporphyrinogen decarboxylase
MLCGTPQQFIVLAEAEPDAVRGALRAIAATLTDYAQAAIDAGAAGIFYAPLTWASRDTATEEFYEAFGRPFDLPILDAVSGAEFNVLHVCRNNNMLRALLDYPVAAFNWADRGPGNPSLEEIRATTDKSVMGGIDHAALHRMSPDAVAAQAREAMSGGTERLFITGGCAIPPQTPAANRNALAEAVRRSG